MLENRCFSGGRGQHTRYPIISLRKPSLLCSNFSSISSTLIEVEAPALYRMEKLCLRSDTETYGEHKWSIFVWKRERLLVSGALVVLGGGWY